MPIKATFTGDVTELRRSTEQARQEFKKVGTEAEGAARQLKAVGSSFDGSRLEGAARRAATSIERIGGVARLTDSEVAKNSRTISELLQKYERMGVEAPANIRKLGAELDALRHKSASLKDIGPPESATKSFGLLQGAVAGVAAAISTQALSSIKSFTADVIEMAGGISDLAVKTGLTTTQVQQFGYAAAQTGTSVDTIANAVTQLSNRLVEGGTGTVSAVHQLGLELADLQRMDPGEAFTTIADAIAKVPDPMKQTQLAMELFGKAGAEILPAIKQGMSELAAEATRLGLVIDDSAIQALDNFGDSWDRMALRAKVSAAGVLADTIRIVDALMDVGRFAASAIPQGTPAGTAANVAGSVISSPFSLGAVGLYGAASRFTNQYLLPTTSADLPGAPAARPLPFGAVPGGMTSRELAHADASLARIEAAYKKAAGAAKQLSAAQREVNADAARAFTVVSRAGQGWEEYAGNVQLARMEMEAFIDMQPDTLIGATNPLSAITSGPYAYQISSNMTGGVLNGTRQIAQATKDWRVEVRGVAQAFAQLAQIAGPSLNGVTRGIGTVFASVDAASQLVESLSGMVGGLGTRDAEGNFQMSGAGRALSGGLAGLSIGLQVGQLGLSRGKSFLAGAAGGAVTGGMTGGFVGAGAGALIGGFAALYSGDANRRAQAAAIQQQREQIVTSMGGIDEFRRAVERTGEAYGKFLNEFLSSDVDVFTGAVNRLNRALTTQQAEATTLAKALASVSSVQGVLSRQQLQQLHDVGRRGGPGSEAIVEFAEQQRAQAEQGLTSAIAAITPSLTDAEIENLTRGISDAAERARVIEEELVRRSRATLDQFGLGAQAAASGLYVAFTEAVRQGESAISVLTRLKKPIQDLQQLYARAGQTPGAGFQNLQVLSDIATGPQTGPAVQLAQGLGQALAGFANTGLLSPALFKELANGIGQAYHQLELFGKGGLEAARLMQPSLQTIWQMIQDHPKLRDELDDTTLALLDFAEQNGLVGDQFRPAIDRMLKALDLLIAKIGDLIDAIAGVPPIEVPVTYVPGEGPPPPPGTPGGPPSGHQPPPIDPVTPMALGGIVTRPTHAIIGEAGPEAIIPLARLSNWGGEITVITPVIVDGREVARVVNRYQGDERRLVGAA